MSNDAKLGLVAGMGLVIAVAVVFFRKDALSLHVDSMNKPISAAVAATPAGIETPAAASAKKSERQEWPAQGIHD